LKKDKKLPSLNSSVNILHEKLYLFLSLLICITIPLFIYSNTFKAPFIFDDFSSIVDNSDIKNINNLRSSLIFRAESYENRNMPTRPLTYLTFALNNYLGDLNTFGYHLFNIILHILNTILVFLLTRRIFYYVSNSHDFFIPIATALMFGCHPMNVDAVTYIVARSGSLATFFYLFSILLFIRTVENNRFYYAGSLLCFILALSSKQTAATTPAILLIFDYIFISKFSIDKVLKKKYLHLPYWVLLFIFFTFSQIYFGELGQMGTTWQPSKYFIIQPLIVLNYIKLLIIPVGQCIDHFFSEPKTIFEFRIFISFISLTGGFLLIFWLVKKSHKLFSENVHSVISKNSLGDSLFTAYPIYIISLYSILWFFITLSPTSSFFPINEPMADRRVYLPSWGFSLLMICGYLMIFRVNLKNDFNLKRYKVMIVFIMIHIFLLSRGVWNRNQLYQNPVKLFQEAITKYPNNPRAYYNLGLLQYKQNDNINAQISFEKAIELNPKDFRSYSNLGLIQYEKEAYDHAIKLFKKAIALNPNDTKSLSNLGSIYYEHQQYGIALALFQKAIQQNPNFPQAHFNLGLLYSSQNKHFSALKSFQKVIELNPADAESYNHIGIIYTMQNEYDKAQLSFRNAIKLDPDDTKAYDNLRILTSIENKQEKQ